MEKFLYKKCENKNPKINVQFAYPAIESFAMASLGYLTIFQMLDSDSEIFVERVYSDSKTTFLPKDKVDFLGFSTSFEIDILTIIKMLKKYDIPLKSTQRKEDDPIIFAGGPVLMSNPFPYEEFYDFISIGEKTALKNAFDILKDKHNLTRDELLEKLSNVDGIYVPKFKKNVVNIVRDDIRQDVVFTPILSEKSFFKDTFVIELERGCPKMCRFCLASWLNTPVRFVETEKILEAIDFGLNHTNKLALLGAYVAGHPDFDKIIKHIANKAQQNPIELSISSLRADLADIELVETLVQCGQKSATIAIEAASQRLRNFIGKDLTEEQILKTVATAKKGGLKALKMYAMIGLPTETDEDIEAFVTLAKKIKEEIKKTPGNFEITISASTFIPKAHTPFEKLERADKKILENRINFLKKNLHKIGVQFRSPSVEWDIVQSILSRYDESLADFLIEVTESGGNLGAFKQVWRKYNKKGILPPFESAAKIPLNNTKTLKWNFISTGANDLKERQESSLEETSFV